MEEEECLGETCFVAVPLVLPLCGVAVSEGGEKYQYSLFRNMVW